MRPASHPSGRADRLWSPARAICRYEVVRKIGQGSFGIVNLCRSTDKSDADSYVVKEIDMGQMCDAERQSALPEADVLSTLRDHQFVVKCFESFMQDNTLFIVMEYCDGGDLAQRIQETKQAGSMLEEKQILTWFVQMALALQYIHGLNILHRDLKSQNIFLTGSGEAKIGDFGISKVLNSDTELAQTVIGTPYYLSPEICEGRPYSKSSDIWSLGCILYELVTLRRAFTGKNLPNLVMKILRGKYPPIPKRYSGDLKKLITAMLQQNPNHRPSVEDILSFECMQDVFYDRIASKDDDDSDVELLPMEGLDVGHVAKSGVAVVVAKEGKAAPPDQASDDRRSQASEVLRRSCAHFFSGVSRARAISFCLN